VVLTIANSFAEGTACLLLDGDLRGVVAVETGGAALARGLQPRVAWSK
jgi:hypothetical protein